MGTYGTIETIIIYNALLPFIFAPINFICAVSFIRFYRSYMKDEDDKGGGGGNDEGNDGNANDEEEESESLEQQQRMEITNSKMEMTKFLFSIKRHWLGIQPSTICLRIGVNNDAIYKLFQRPIACACA